MGVDGVDANAIDIVESGGKGDGALDVGSAGLVFERQLVIGRAGEADLLDHFPAALPWRQLVEQRGTAPQHANAGGRVHLVPGKRQEIGS